MKVWPRAIPTYGRAPSPVRASGARHVLRSGSLRSNRNGQPGIEKQKAVGGPERVFLIPEPALSEAEGLAPKETGANPGRPACQSPRHKDNLICQSD
jgi:hypothetical protein